ncbi:MAG: SGNH/GDSL hydrolase family protein [Geodermatophilaceae bacterium]|nr:SGNH/GDSL hydrolase family protein [Geodermatophilaceae bacterium]
MALLAGSAIAFFALPGLAAAGDPLEIALVGFRACSGATTPKITQVAQYPTQPPQIASFPTDVDIVSMSIGGNDIGFPDFAQACVLRQGCGGPTMLNATLAKINGQLPGRLADTYASLRAAAGPTTEVFVLGYPQIVGAVRQGGGCSYLTGQERPIIRDVVAQLNGVISQASAAAGFTYLDATTAGSPFLGHELCTRGSYFTNISSAFPFHPNLNGQGAYQDLLTRALRLAGFLAG